MRQRTNLDALRSLTRYVALMLPDWEVRMAEEDGVFERPFAMILATTPANTEQPMPVHVDVTQGFGVYLYPEEGENPEDSLGRAYAAQEVVTHGFTVGVGVGAPSRIPLYDYSGGGRAGGAAIPLGVPAEEADRDYCDYLRLLRPGLDFQPPQRDPDDENLYQLVVTLRCGWRRRARVPSGPALTSVRLTETGS